MKASVGDRIVVPGHHVGDATQAALILALEGEGGEPPYLVRWESDGHEGLFFPGADAMLEEHEPSR